MSFAACPANDLLRDLVGLPSVNPAFGDDPAVCGEARIASWLEEWFAERGFRTERIEKTPGRPNLLVRFGPEAARRRVLFETHLDTVGVSGFEGNPFELRAEGDRLYGRGACDTKGPLAAFMAALDGERLTRLASAGVELAWLGAIGEETGNLGAEECAAEGVRADDCIVLEPTELRVVHAHKGACWFTATMRGKAAHGSDPSRGDNAILKMPAVWRAIEEATAEAAARHAVPGLGGPTVSLGMIRGGVGANVVPDRCAMTVDRRFVPGETCAGILDDLRARLAEVPGGVDLELLKEGLAFYTDAAAELPRRFCAALATAGAAPTCEGAAWCSDAGVLAPVCGQTLVWGPGSIAQAHTCNEHIEAESLACGVETVRHFLDGLGGGA
jgi:acetylornithine deacetylase/succinyl-diaminopimelate desuccinylase-like protein